MNVDPFPTLNDMRKVASANVKTAQMLHRAVRVIMAVGQEAEKREAEKLVGPLHDHFSNCRKLQRDLRAIYYKTSQVAAFDCAVIPEVYEIALHALTRIQAAGGQGDFAGLSKEKWEKLLTFALFWLPDFGRAGELAKINYTKFRGGDHR